METIGINIVLVATYMVLFALVFSAFCIPVLPTTFGKPQAGVTAVRTFLGVIVSEITSCSFLLLYSWHCSIFSLARNIAAAIMRDQLRLRTRD